MDFVSGFSCTSWCSNDVLAIVDPLTKLVHFLSIYISYNAEIFTHIYVLEIIHLHRVRISIISNKDSVFTASFCKTSHEELGTQVDLSIAFHPQINGQLTWIIFVIEGMFSAYFMDFRGQWE